jgi:hypothetical protein
MLRRAILLRSILYKTESSIHNIGGGGEGVVSKPRGSAREWGRRGERGYTHKGTMTCREI